MSRKQGRPKTAVPVFVIRRHMAFTYLFKIKLGTDLTGLSLKAALQDKDGAAVLFADGDATKTAGFIEQGVGDYSFWSDQWPDESLPFTVRVLNAAGDVLLTTADMNEQDFAPTG